MMFTLFKKANPLIRSACLTVRLHLPYEVIANSLFTSLRFQRHGEVYGAQSALNGPFIHSVTSDAGLQRESGVDAAGGEGYGMYWNYCFIDNAPWKVSKSRFF